MSAADEGERLDRALEPLVDAVSNGRVTEQEVVQRLRALLSNLTLTGGGAAAAASGPGDSVGAIVGSTVDRPKRGRTPDVADGAASEGGVSFELSYGNLERAWLGSDLIETGGTITLQVLSTDHFAEHARTRVKGKPLEVVRVWVIVVGHPRFYAYSLSR